MNIHQNLKQLVANERACTFLVLEKLNELERTRKFSELGYSSLFKYCVEELKYSEDQACRRISAARLLKTIPEIAPKVQNGELNLTQLSKANTLFNHVTMENAEKIKIINSLENKTNRDCEKIIRTIDPIKTAGKEKIKPLQENLSEVKFFASDELLTKMEKVKQILNNDKLESIFNKICDEFIAKHESAEKNLPTTLISADKKSRYIPQKVKAIVRRNAQHQCEFVGSNGMRCTQKTHLEFAHKIPYAHGGNTSVSNLQLFCFSHNQLDAIQVFGLNKMRKYFKR